MRMGPLILYLSPSHPHVNIKMALNTYGGVDKHCAAAMLKPRLFRRMIGRKKATCWYQISHISYSIGVRIQRTQYVTVVKQL